MHTAFNVDGIFPFNKIDQEVNQFISYTISLTDLIHIAGTKHYIIGKGI
jgi:hypothetical protein